MDCFISNFKLKHDNLENIKAAQLHQFFEPSIMGGGGGGRGHEDSSPIITLLLLLE